MTTSIKNKIITVFTLKNDGFGGCVEEKQAGMPIIEMENGLVTQVHNYGKELPTALWLWTEPGMWYRMLGKGTRFSQTWIWTLALPLIGEAPEFPLCETQVFHHSVQTETTKFNLIP